MPRSIMEAVVFMHYILSNGIRVLQSGSHPLPEGAEAIHAGATQPHLLAWLTKRRLDWRMRWVPLSVVTPSKAEAKKGITAKDKVKALLSSTAKNIWWVEDDRVIIFEVKNLGIGDLFTHLGLAVQGVAKAPKRLKEIGRLVYMTSVEAPRLDLVSHYVHDETDGRAAIDREYAIGLLRGCLDQRTFRKVAAGIRGGVITTMKLRILGPLGELKVEANIVAGLRNGLDQKVDLRFHESEWKKELRTSNGEWFVHGWPEAHTTGPAFMDAQTASWLRDLAFPLELMKETVSAFFADALVALRAGHIPEGFLFDGFNAETGKVELKPKDIQRMHENAHLWQMCGLDIRSSANFTRMIWGALATSALARDAWAPVPFAVRAHVTTRRFVEDLCGFSVPEGIEDDEVYFDKRVNCLVYPTELFLALAVFHGGWDQDGDSVVMALRFLNGEIVGLCWRNPNAPGEYAIVKVAADTIPLFNHELSGIGMPELDITKAPKGVREMPGFPEVGMMEGIEWRELPKPAKNANPGPWDEAFAEKMLDEIMSNPGIGKVANVWIVMSDLGIVPAWAYPMEDCVDACMQEPYGPAFEAIEKWLEYAWGLVKKHGEVDRFFTGGMTRIDGDEPVFIPAGVMPPKGRAPKKVVEFCATRDGYFAELQGHIWKTVKDYNQQLDSECFQLRLQYPIAWELVEDGFFPAKGEEGHEESLPLRLRGVRLLEGANERFSELSELYPDTFANRFNGFSPAEAVARTRENRVLRSAAAKDIVKLYADALGKVDPADRTTILFAALRKAIMPRHSAEEAYGVSDRIFYGNAPEGEVGVFHFLLGALIRGGFADAPEELRRELAEDIRAAMGNQNQG